MRPFSRPQTGDEGLASRSGRLISQISLVTLTLIWGSTFPMIKVVVNSIGFAYYVTLRFGLATLLLAPIVVARKSKWLGDCWMAGMTLGFLFFGGITLQGLGMEYTTASNAAFITSLSAVLVYVMEVLTGRERPSKRLSTAVCLSVLGLYLMSTTDSLHLHLGDLVVLLGAFFWALQIMSVGRYSRRFDLAPLLFLENGFTALGGFVTALFFKPPTGRALASVAVHLLYLATICTVLANALQLYGQRVVSSVEAAIIYLLEPIFASILSALLLREQLAPKQLAGAFAIITAVALSSSRSFQNRVDN
ncbi:MAG: hypothetical protein DRJ43_03305 [Thermoprotei archaeon]|nr:MAG: hypothetical protein DRJ43_03305 [Thermoprotei archaeon]